MENRFTDRSERNLNEAHKDLQALFRQVIQIYDCEVIEGFRSQIEQDKLVSSGRSKKRWPFSKHNKLPCDAVDVIPKPIDWSNDPQNIIRFYYFAGIVKGIAFRMGIKIRWGGDWDNDNEFRDQTFNDLVHFELE